MTVGLGVAVTAVRSTHKEQILLALPVQIKTGISLSFTWQCLLSSGCSFGTFTTSPLQHIHIRISQIATNKEKLSLSGVLLKNKASNRYCYYTNQTNLQASPPAFYFPALTWRYPIPAEHWVEILFPSLTETLKKHPHQSFASSKKLTNSHKTICPMRKMFRLSGILMRVTY